MESFELLEHLVTNLHPKTKYLFIGGFRSDEVDEDHYLMEYLKKDDDLAAANSSIIEVHELTQPDVSLFIVDTLKLEESAVAFVVRHVFNATKGNIFFVREYLEFLQTTGHIFWDVKHLKWTWDESSDYWRHGDGDMSGNAVDMKEVVEKKILRMVSFIFQYLSICFCSSNERV